MRLGDIELRSLSDGHFRLDGGAMFGIVPKALWERRTRADDRNRIPLSLRPLLIRTGESTVLVDAGVGDKLSSKEIDIYDLDRSEHLEASLAAEGVSPGDIDIVIATHLHFDHVGGLTRRIDGALVPTFPRARHLIRRGEWEDALRPNEHNRASYMAGDFVPLEAAGLVEFIDEDREVVAGVHVVKTGGHTMHHQIVRVDGGSQTAVYAADLLPTAAHVDEPWIMGYDLYPMDTLNYKRAFLREAIEREYVIFFEHDPTMTAGIIRLENGRKRVAPVEA